jgi:hypothetical protein
MFDSSKYISRRSAIGRLTSMSFGLAGVQIAYRPSMAGAAWTPGVDPHEDCGLTGGKCGSGCATLGSPAGWWSKCCRITAASATPSGTIPAVYKCCTYTDICAATDSPAIAACRVINPSTAYISTQVQWCGSGATPVYVCTQTTCGAAESFANCASHCGGSSYGP